jgi:hypothetical protein
MYVPSKKKIVLPFKITYDLKGTEYVGGWAEVLNPWHPVRASAVLLPRQNPCHYFAGPNGVLARVVIAQVAVTQV